MGLVIHPGHSVSEIDADVDPERLRRAKKAYSTRFLADCLALLPNGYELWDVEPSAGDFILARTTEIGHHPKLESPGSRRQSMFVGDEILVAFCDRYALDQFLAVVPEDLDPCSEVAGGGPAAKATGTGSGTDPWLFTHAGTQHVLDFTDFGFPTTFLMDHATVRGLLTSLINALTTAETDVVVVEIADRIAADCQGGVRGDRCAGHQYVRSVHAGDGTEAAAGEQVGG
ncbi:MAG: hypothetical protein JWN05_2158 [Arthrobacter sp.]|jgi:hypothetical protein|nr:hypothetical protein [Arthrobacter sp.]